MQIKIGDHIWTPLKKKKKREGFMWTNWVSLEVFSFLLFFQLLANCFLNLAKNWVRFKMRHYAVRVFFVFFYHRKKKVRVLYYLFFFFFSWLLEKHNWLNWWLWIWLLTSLKLIATMFFNYISFFSEFVIWCWWNFAGMSIDGQMGYKSRSLLRFLLQNMLNI